MLSLLVGWLAFNVAFVLVRAWVTRDVRETRRQIVIDIFDGKAVR